jgi:hypothetical protein
MGQGKGKGQVTNLHQSQLSIIIPPLYARFPLMCFRQQLGILHQVVAVRYLHRCLSLNLRCVG